VGLYRNLEQCIARIDREVAYWLARTPGAWLTSSRALAYPAAGWTAELGPPSQWYSVRQLCSYSGVVPKSKQTGGPDKEPIIGAVQARCHKRLKNVVLQAVEKSSNTALKSCAERARTGARGAHTELRWPSAGCD